MVELFWIKSQKQKKPADLTISRLKNSRQRPTFPQPYSGSIIGPGGLNFRVRDGNGCDPSGMATGNCEDCVYQEQIIVKPHGRLVLVGYRPYGPSTSSLSNS